jgi:hypothetical protein
VGGGRQVGEGGSGAASRRRGAVGGGRQAGEGRWGAASRRSKRAQEESWGLRWGQRHRRGRAVFGKVNLRSTAPKSVQLVSNQARYD